MPRTPDQLTDADLAFLLERHLGTLTTIDGNGDPHVVAIAFTFDSGTGTARVITSDGSQKVVNVEATGRAVVAQVDGRRWLSLAGPATVARATAAVEDAERLYAVRYRPPRDNPSRVVIEITVDRVLGSG